MKKVGILTILLSLAHFSWINLPPISKKFSKVLNEKWSFVPSGMAKLNGNLQNVEAFYISKTEVSNIEYLTFLEDLKIKNPALYSVALPDTSVWRIGNSPQYAFEKQYFRYPGFRKYPVVGISFDAAVLYCKWVEENINAKAEGNEKVSVRLPNEAEWVRAARGDKHLSFFTWGGPNLQNKKGHILANYRKDNPIDFRGTIITTEIKMFPPNEFGIYQMCGNVAEMLNDSKKTKGGSWNSEAKDTQINASENINYPANNVGFRPVLIVKAN